MRATKSSQDQEEEEEKIEVACKAANLFLILTLFTAAILLRAPCQIATLCQVPQAALPSVCTLPCPALAWPEARANHTQHKAMAVTKAPATASAAATSAALTISMASVLPASVRRKWCAGTSGHIKLRVLFDFNIDL